MAWGEGHVCSSMQVEVRGDNFVELVLFFDWLLGIELGASDLSGECFTH